MGVYPKGIQIYTPTTKEFSTPTLSRSFAVASFQLRLVFGIATEGVPPNDSAARFIGFGDKVCAIDKRNEQSQVAYT